MKTHNIMYLLGLACTFVLVTGCQDNMLLNPTDSMVAGVKGASAPGTVVTGTGSFGTVSEAKYVEAGGTPVSGPSGGQCLSGGTWINPANNSTHAQHTHCTISAGGQVISVEITLSVLANDVQAKNGNRNLNFHDIDAYIHYQSNQNRTKGEGFVIATGDDGSEWSIDLSQVNGGGNWFNGLRELTAVNGDDEATVVLSW